MSDDDALDDMTAAVLERIDPWIEDGYLALRKPGSRVELFDGSLLVSPAPTFRHQLLATALNDVFRRPAREAGLQVLLAINLRLRSGRVVIPDLVINRPVDPNELVMEVRDVALVCEITSTNVGADRITKMHYYAEAGIPRYLIVEPKGPMLELYRLDGDKYVLEASAGPGERLLVTEPVVAEIDPGSLVE
jgi:Uma2 family endonuclease